MHGTLRLYNKLPQKCLQITCMYCLSVTVSQQCEHHLTGSSAQGFTRLSSRHQSSCALSYKACVLFQTHMVTGKIQFLLAMGLGSYFLLNVGQGQLSGSTDLLPVPYHVAHSQWAPSSQYGILIFQGQQKNLLLQSPKGKVLGDKTS